MQLKQPVIYGAFTTLTAVWYFQQTSINNNPLLQHTVFSLHAAANIQVTKEIRSTLRADEICVPLGLYPPG